MIRRNTPAITAAEVMSEAMDDLREVLLGIACQIIVSSGDEGLAETYLGIGLEDFSTGSMPGNFRELLEGIDLDRFGITVQIKTACAFALQMGTAAERTDFSEDDWGDLEAFLSGAPHTSFGGEMTPLAKEDGALRRTLEMTMARMKLLHGSGLTIRELSLLADIGETAVRTSLSADGIKTEGKPARVSAEVAEPWLLRRRGFVPTLVLEESSEALSPLALEVNSLTAERGVSMDELASMAGVDRDWLGGLVSGEAVPYDVGGLCRMATALGVDPAGFAGRAVEELIRRR